MTLILRRLEQWSFGGADGQHHRWRRPRRSSYTRLHSSLISRGRETMGGRGLIRDDPFGPEDRTRRPTGAEAAEAEGGARVSSDDQRSFVKIEVLLGRSVEDIHDSLRAACGGGAVQRSTVHYWASVFGSAAYVGHTLAAEGREIVDWKAATRLDII